MMNISKGRTYKATSMAMAIPFLVVTIILGLKELLEEALNYYFSGSGVADSYLQLVGRVPVVVVGVFIFAALLNKRDTLVPVVLSGIIMALDLILLCINLSALTNYRHGAGTEDARTVLVADVLINLVIFLGFLFERKQTIREARWLPYLGFITCVIFIIDQIVYFILFEKNIRIFLRNNMFDISFYLAALILFSLAFMFRQKCVWK
ncbi:hypothetical protein [Butyrivibrio proteoclasticus]|uniref:hypothetical protein n=1 Tax=Butyrivibrio proteoclasticus TaxID=43305 RepID=UPI00047B33E2|nr:hypothetical protein [Butyrivibrio proteoclasticus]